MYLRSKLILAALAASALLAIAAGDTAARNLSINERNFELIWNETLGTGLTKLRITGGGRTVACRVTLLGSFVERTIKKETIVNAANIHHGEVESCEGGSVTLRTETMPWPERYRSFTGTLPRIRSITDGLIGAVIKVTANEGQQCEVGTEVNHPAVGIAGNSAAKTESGFETTGEPEFITAEERTTIPLGGEFACAFSGSGAFSGIGLIRNLPRTAKTRTTLI